MVKQTNKQKKTGKRQYTLQYIGNSYKEWAK